MSSFEKTSGRRDSFVENDNGENEKLRNCSISYDQGGLTDEEDIDIVQDIKIIPSSFEKGLTNKKLFKLSIHTH